jgi:hypothetical protein
LHIKGENLVVEKSFLFVIEMVLLEKVSTLSMDQLNSLVISGIWKDEPEIVTAIYDRFTQLVAQPDFPSGQNAHFGTPEFWKEVLGPDTPDLVF